MSTEGERDLIDLVAREQRGFRRILIAGVVMLFALLAMSAALGVYYFQMSRQLGESTRDLQKQAFDTRILLDQQTNRLSAQERNMRYAFGEIRAITAAGATGTPDQALPGGLQAAADYMRKGGAVSIGETRLIELGAAAPTASEQQRALLNAAGALIAWRRDGGTIFARGGQRNSQQLPQDLADARANFQAAAADPQLAPIARAGVAWIEFLYASSGRSNYAETDCQRVFDAVKAATEAGDAGAQVLWWQAQCERKLGRSTQALATYARLLEQSAPSIRGQDARADSADLDAARELAMNGYHGVGTTLISSFSAPDRDIASALAIARANCRIGERAGAVENERMRLAIACLNQAVRLRRQLGQNQNQQSGSRENLGFAYLRAGDVSAAFDNAQRVNETGYFAWNELLRALTAARLETPNRDVERAAARNVGFFSIAQFNVCELRQLLDEEMYEAAVQLISSAHDGAEVSCVART